MRGFFAINKQAFDSACCHSKNAAISYLVLACGTGGNNATTKWSVAAIERYTSISRGRAKKAIDSLIALDVVSRVKGGKHPQYKLLVERESSRLVNTIWLPASIVLGANGETPAIERLRQVNDVMLLRLFIELYDEQNLSEHGGVNPYLVHKAYSREYVSERAQFNIWAFSSGAQSVRWASEVTSIHIREELTLAEEEAGQNRGVDFFSRLERLYNLGLFTWVPYLMDCEDHQEAEIIHALDGDTDAERSLGCDVREAAESLLTEEIGMRVEDCCYLAPVPHHIESPSLVGVMRMKHRPNTRLTSEWWAKTNRRALDYSREYKEISGKNENVQYQG